ncbi:MAG: site-2 protease family protein [Elusimicrobiaceae bacterium]|nr:site-2 protease family protein [Elusimicrobiaceae bacterium]
MDIIVLLPVLFFSIILHEFAHGWIAYRMGDDTAYYSGRLTLNPLSHVDPVGTLAVPAVCWLFGWPLFGWAKPVPVNPTRLPAPRKDMGKVAFAGPAVNLILAALCAGLLKVSVVLQGHLTQQVFGALVYILQYGLFVNVFLAVFNLIPIPPLDGGRVLTALLPVQVAVRYDHLVGRYGMWIVVALVLTGVVKYILFPPTFFIVSVLTKMFGL